MENMELRPEDRGWNDPPIVNFNESNQGVKRGKLLNKRVAFPINGSVGGTTMGTGYPSMPTSSMQASSMQTHPMPGQESYMYNTSQGMPGGPNYYQQSTETYYPTQQPNMGEYPQSNAHQQDPYMSSGPVEQPQPVQYHQQNIHQANDSLLQLDEAIRNFNDLMNGFSPQALSKDEVGKSFQILQSMWREQKLTPEVQDMTFQISIALRNGDANYAESLLSSLSVNHFDSCREWISGPRALMQAALCRQGGY